MAKPITVGDNVWLGANVTILPGVTIGEGKRYRRGERGDEGYPGPRAGSGESVPGRPGDYGGRQDMQTVYIMIGIPGAGKTTYAKTKLAHAAYLGTDAIREELFGKELTLRGHKRVHQIMHERMLHYLEEGRDVVIDCTNITRKRRKILLNVIPPGHQIVALFMDTPLCRQ